MAIVLSLESVEEFLDYWGDDTGHITWRLTPSEVKAVLQQRHGLRSCYGSVGNMMMMAMAYAVSLSLCCCCEVL